MRIGIVGCGFVSALYLRTLQLRENLEIVGVTDLNRQRAERFAKHAGCRVYDDTEHLFNSSDAEIIVNLTNPGAHYEVNRAALLKGKHVYCEKPLATKFSEAKELVELSHDVGRQLSGAPCNVLSEAAQSVWREIRRKSCGTPRLVYAELDDGMVPLAPYQKWENEFGVPWPAKDEFEIGCTLEHAGYYLTWLAAFFGPAESVTRFGGTAIVDKLDTEKLDRIAPDFTVACIRFRSGTIARLTCSIVAPHDHRLRIIGDEGVISVPDCWDYRSRASIRKWMKIRRKLLLSPVPIPLRLPPPVSKLSRFGAATMDFARGVEELADAIRQDRPCRLSSEFCLHTNELALAIHNGETSPGCYEVETVFDPMEPMPWAW